MNIRSANVTKHTSRFHPLPDDTYHPVFLTEMPNIVHFNQFLTPDSFEDIVMNISMYIGFMILFVFSIGAVGALLYAVTNADSTFVLFRLLWCLFGMLATSIVIPYIVSLNYFLDRRIGRLESR